MLRSKFRILASLIALSSLPAAGTVTGALAQTEPAAPETTQEEQSPIEAATDFAKSLTDAATAALTQDGASEAEKLASFQTVLADGLALEVIGKFMLGETRKTITDPQQARYDTVFPDYITKLYADQFADIVGRPLTVVDAQALGARDVIVRTQFDRTNGDPINLDWRIRKLRSGDQKAIDIIVNGVSIMLVKREEFSAFIAANGVDGLLDRLEAEIAAPA